MAKGKKTGQPFQFTFVLILIGVIIICALIYMYSNNKSKTKSSMVSNMGGDMSLAPSPLAPSPTIFTGESPITIGTPNLPLENEQDDKKLNPSDLLPSGNSNVTPMNFLQASTQIQSINTQGGTLRNPNLQLRSEPPNPQNQVSPWQNTTIEPDLMRSPFEIGCPCSGSSPQ